MEEEVETSKELDQALTETISATLKDIQSRPVEDEPVVEKTAPDASDKAVEAVSTKEERARDKDGKFIKAEALKEPAKESAAPAKADTLDPKAGPASAQAAVEPEQPLVTTKGQPIDINRAPSSLKPQAKVDWANTPVSVREEFHRREANFLNGGKDLKENADLGQRMKAVIDPYRQMIEAEGGTPENSIANYFRTAAALRAGSPEQKLQMLFQLDQQFGAGLNQHFQKTVQNEVARLTGQQIQPTQQAQTFQDPRVDQILARFNQEEKARAAQEERISGQATEKFLSAKDDKGQTLYPFVDNVIEDMSARVKSLRQANPSLAHDEILKQAYDASVWANPETRSVLIGQQQATAAKPQEQLQKVEQAKRASAGNMPKRGGLPQSAPTAKWGTPEADEEIRATYRQLVNQ